MYIPIKRVGLCGALIFGLLASRADAQITGVPPDTEIPQQSVYLEIGGNGLVYSLNYDALFRSNWGLRLGGSFYPFDVEHDEIHTSDDESYAFLGLVMGLYAIGKKAHKLELGAGGLFGTIYDRERWDFIEPPGATFSMGYRYYPDEPSHFTFKVAFTPTVTRSGLHPRIGISLGITLTEEGDASL